MTSPHKVGERGKSPQRRASHPVCWVRSGRHSHLNSHDSSLYPWPAEAGTLRRCECLGCAQYPRNWVQLGLSCLTGTDRWPPVMYLPESLPGSGLSALSGTLCLYLEAAMTVNQL